jgi:hypothetical protein
MTNNGKIIFISYLACRRFSRSPSRFVFYDQKDILRPTAWDHRLSNPILRCLMQNAQAYSTAHCACLEWGSVQRKSFCSALNSIQVYINVLCICLQYSLIIYICIYRNVAQYTVQCTGLHHYMYMLYACLQCSTVQYIQFYIDLQMYRSVAERTAAQELCQIIFVR